MVDREFLVNDQAFGLPVFPLDEIRTRFNPDEVYFHVAVPYTDMNLLRSKRFETLRGMGYQPASYVSPHAYVDPTSSLGEHVFIFENNVVQPFVQIGNGVVLWSGNHIGHHSRIEDWAFVSSHVVVSGHCVVGKRTFLGVNATLGNNVSVGNENWILPNTLLLSDTSDGQMWKPPRSEMAKHRPPGSLNEPATSITESRA